MFAYYIAPFGAVVEFSTAVNKVRDDYKVGAPEDGPGPRAHRPVGTVGQGRCQSQGRGREVSVPARMDSNGYLSAARQHGVARVRYVSFAVPVDSQFRSTGGRRHCRPGEGGNAAADLKGAIASESLESLSPGRRYPLTDVVLLPVIPNPSKILCVGHNYESHRQETGRAKSDYPSIFTRFADTLVAHRQPIVRPRVSTNLDYEGELAIVIGRGGRAIAEADAMKHLAGYACFNDASVRDWQWHTSQFTPAKLPWHGRLGRG